MFDLLKNELLRFRLWVAAAAVVNLGVLGFLGRMVDPLQQPGLVYQVTGAVYGVLGLLLGLYQMGSYRRPATWLYLLHRPLPPARVASALALAAAMLLGLAVALPVLILVGGQELLTARVVDARHWGLPLAAWLVSIAGYLAGACTMLAPPRRAVFVLALPLLLFAGGATGLAALALQLAVVAWLALVLRASFKPDLSSLPASGLQQVLVAAPVVLGAYALLVMGSLLYQLGWMLVGSHPLNSTPPVGGFLEASRADAQVRLLAGLAGVDRPELPLWHEQVKLSEVHSVTAGFREFPRRHQLTNPTPLDFDDAQRRWTFSHDTMRFQGMALADRRRDGHLGLGDDHARFAQVPMPVGEGWLAAPDGLYHYDADRGLLQMRVRIPAPEVLASLPATAGEAQAVLSDRALYLFDPRALADDEGPVAPRLRLALPGHIGDLADLELVELLDGYLVSFLFGRASIDAPGASWQETWWLHGNGQAERLGRRTLDQDFPLALRHYAWWLSPLLHELQDAGRWLSPPDPLAARAPVATPGSIRVLAAALMLMSLLLAAMWLRHAGLGRRRRLAWCLACAAFGLPALVALWLMHPRPERALAGPVDTMRPSPA